MFVELCVCFVSPQNNISPQVVRSLKALEGRTFENGAVVEVRDMDYNLLSFEDQIKNDLDTDIMVSSRLSLL